MRSFRDLRRRARRVLSAAGLAPSASPAPAPPADPQLASVLDRLTRLGLAPRTVFDVGVGSGTPELYAAFPSARHVLVEPLVEFEPALAAISARYRAERVAAAAGSRPGRRILHVHRDLLGSSLLPEVEGPAVDGVPREVAVVTLDDVARERGLEGPFVIKADVQGAELEVLEGAASILAATEAVLLEASLFRFFTGGPILDEVVAWMKARRFVAWDLWGRLERPLDGALAQVDLAFVPESSPLRASHAFATPEQRRR